MRPCGWRELLALTRVIGVIFINGESVAIEVFDHTHKECTITYDLNPCQSLSWRLPVASVLPDTNTQPVGAG